MKKYTIQASIDELEKKVAAGGSGASAADDVSFDNTGTGLSSDNVQDAIEELEARDVMSTNETIVGKFTDGSILYEKTFDTGALPNNTGKTLAHGITGLDKVISIVGAAHDPTNDYYNPLPSSNPGDDRYSIGVNVTSTNIIITTVVDMSLYTSSYVTVRYTKTSTTNRRKK